MSSESFSVVSSYRGWVHHVTLALRAVPGAIAPNSSKQIPFVSFCSFSSSLVCKWSFFIFQFFQHNLVSQSSRGGGRETRLQDLRHHTLRSCILLHCKSLILCSNSWVGSS